MFFPDQSHINQVRDALWRRSGGGASVMVGSGFSRNALKVRPGAKPLPMWDDLTKEMFNKLYPQENNKKLSTQNPLKLAQEYESTFGRSDLNRYLQQLVRDDEFKPGCAYERLLKLPWRDIFTTKSYCQILCMAVVNQAAFLPVSLSSIPSMNFTSASTQAN